MATHSSVLAWRIPGTGEPGGLPSMGSPRVRCDLSDLAAAAVAADPSCKGSRDRPWEVGAWPRGLSLSDMWRQSRSPACPPPGPRPPGSAPSGSCCKPQPFPFPVVCLPLQCGRFSDTSCAPRRRGDLHGAVGLSWGPFWHLSASLPRPAPCLDPALSPGREPRFHHRLGAWGLRQFSFISSSLCESFLGAQDVCGPRDVDRWDPENTAPGPHCCLLVTS